MKLLVCFLLLLDVCFVVRSTGNFDETFDEFETRFVAILSLDDFFSLSLAIYGPTVFSPCFCVLLKSSLMRERGFWF